MKTAAVVTVALALFQGALGTFVPLYHYERIANDENAPEDVRARANFTYHHTIKLQKIREANVAAGEGFDPNLDDDQFDIEQDPDQAARIAAERAAMQNAQDNQPVEPGVTEGAGMPGRAKRDDRFKKKRQGPPAAYIGVWDADQGCKLDPPNHKVRERGSPFANDATVNTLYNNIDTTERFYRTRFGRYAINDTGGGIWATTHYCSNYNNAIWNGEQQVYGDADGYAYYRNTFSGHLDIVAHEYTHGVIQFSNPLEYFGSTGALNEHLADVFGAMVLQYANNQDVFQASWLNAEGSVVGGRAGRDFANPGTAYNTPALGPDRQVGNFNNYYFGLDDNAGVHLNSGIPNRAFYLFARAIGGYSWIGAPGTIWYNVMTGGQGKFNYQYETFPDFAQKTVNAGLQLYGDFVQQTLADAWRQVGVIVVV